MKYPTYEKFSRIREYFQELKGFYLIKNEAKWRSSLAEFCKISPLAGSTFHEIYLLYHYVINNRIQHILEFGSGVSTVVLADVVHQCLKLKSNRNDCTKFLKSASAH